MGRPKDSRSLQQVLEDGVERIPEAGCWIWTKSANDHGYGGIKRNGKILATHRLSYELHRGPIPAGLRVCHTCDNPSCCNPFHLFLGTASENTHDAVRKGRIGKLTEETVRGIFDATGTLRQIATQFGVSTKTVNFIKHRKTWQHLNLSAA